MSLPPSILFQKHFFFLVLIVFATAAKQISQVFPFQVEWQVSIVCVYIKKQVKSLAFPFYVRLGIHFWFIMTEVS